MLVDFNTTDDQSRIWIYASDNKLRQDQEVHILKFISDHLRNWEAHKVPLTAGVTIFENRFIVVSLDESVNRASGCSIDTLQRLIQNLEKELSISLLNRQNIFCKIEDEILCISLFKLEEIAKADTLFYDLTIQKKSEIYSYLKPISDGWCAHLV